MSDWSDGGDCFGGLKSDLLNEQDVQGVVDDIYAYLKSQFSADDIAAGNVLTQLYDDGFNSSAHTYLNYLDKATKKGAQPLSGSSATILSRQKTRMRDIVRLSDTLRDGPKWSGEKFASEYKKLAERYEKPFVWGGQHVKGYPYPGTLIWEKAKPVLDQLLSDKVDAQLLADHGIKDLTAATLDTWQANVGSTLIDKATWTAIGDDEKAAFVKAWVKSDQQTMSDIIAAQAAKKPTFIEVKMADGSIYHATVGDIDHALDTFENVYPDWHHIKAPLTKTGSNLAGVDYKYYVDLNKDVDGNARTKFVAQLHKWKDELAPAMPESLAPPAVAVEAPTVGDALNVAAKEAVKEEPLATFGPLSLDKDQAKALYDALDNEAMFPALKTAGLVPADANLGDYKDLWKALDDEFKGVTDIKEAIHAHLGNLLGIEAAPEAATEDLTLFGETLTKQQWQNVAAALKKPDSFLTKDLWDKATGNETWSKEFQTQVTAEAQKAVGVGAVKDQQAWLAEQIDKAVGTAPIAAEAPVAVAPAVDAIDVNIGNFVNVTKEEAQHIIDEIQAGEAPVAVLQDMGLIDDTESINAFYDTMAELATKHGEPATDALIDELDSQLLPAGVTAAVPENVEWYGTLIPKSKVADLMAALDPAKTDTSITSAFESVVGSKPNPQFVTGLLDDWKANSVKGTSAQKQFMIGKLQTLAGLPDAPPIDWFGTSLTHSEAESLADELTKSDTFFSGVSASGIDPGKFDVAKIGEWLNANAPDADPQESAKILSGHLKAILGQPADVTVSGVVKAVVPDSVDFFGTHIDGQLAKTIYDDMMAGYAQGSPLSPEGYFTKHGVLVSDDSIAKWVDSFGPSNVLTSNDELKSAAGKLAQGLGIDPPGTVYDFYGEKLTKPEIEALLKNLNDPTKHGLLQAFSDAGHPLDNAGYNAVSDAWYSAAPGTEPNTWVHDELAKLLTQDQQAVDAKAAGDTVLMNNDSPGQKIIVHPDGSAHYYPGYGDPPMLYDKEHFAGIDYWKNSGWYEATSAPLTVPPAVTETTVEFYGKNLTVSDLTTLKNSLVPGKIAHKVLDDFGFTTHNIDKLLADAADEATSVGTIKESIKKLIDDQLASITEIASDEPTTDVVDFFGAKWTKAQGEKIGQIYLHGGSIQEAMEAAGVDTSQYTGDVQKKFIDYLNQQPSQNLAGENYNKLVQSLLSGTTDTTTGAPAKFTDEVLVHPSSTKQLVLHPDGSVTLNTSTGSVNVKAENFDLAAYQKNGWVTPTDGEPGEDSVVWKKATSPETLITHPSGHATVLHADGSAEPLGVIDQHAWAADGWTQFSDLSLLAPEDGEDIAAHVPGLDPVVQKYVKPGDTVFTKPNSTFTIIQHADGSWADVYHADGFASEMAKDYYGSPAVLKTQGFEPTTVVGTNVGIGPKTAEPPIPSKAKAVPTIPVGQTTGVPIPQYGTPESWWQWQGTKVDNYLSQIGIDGTGASPKLKAYIVAAHNEGDQTTFDNLVAHLPAYGGDAKAATVDFGGVQLNANQLSEIASKVTHSYYANPDGGVQAIQYAKTMYGVNQKKAFASAKSEKGVAKKIQAAISQTKQVENELDVQGLMVQEAEQPAQPTIVKPIWSNVEHAKDELGGQHDKWFATDQFGSKWMFKPTPVYQGVAEEFRTDTEEAALGIGRLFGFNMGDSEIGTLNLPGIGEKRGQFQRLFIAQGGKDMRGVAPATLTVRQREDVAKQHVLDWALNNDDTHNQNLMRLKDGSVVGIDKGRAFAEFGNTQLKYGKLDTRAETYYTNLYSYAIQSAQQGDRSILDGMYFSSVRQAREMQKVDDAKLTDLLNQAFAKRPSYATTTANTKDQLIEQVLDRKHNLEGDFEKFYGDLFKKAGIDKPEWPVYSGPALPNTHSPVGITKDMPIGRGAHQGITQALLDMVNVTENHGQAAMFAGPELEDAHMLLWQEWTADGHRVLRGEAYVRKDADKTLTNWFKQQKVENVVSKYAPDKYEPKLPNQDSWYEKIITGAKTISQHAADKQYNPTKIADYEQAKNEVKAAASALDKGLVKAPDLSIAEGDFQAYKDMVSKYQTYLDEIDQMKDVGGTSVPGQWMPYSYTPAAPAEVAQQKADMHITFGQATRSLGEYQWDEGKLVLKGKMVTDPATGAHIVDPKMITSLTMPDDYGGQPGRAYLITMPGDNIQIEYRPWEGASVPKAQQGTLRFTIMDHDGTLPQVQKVMSQLKTMGLNLAPADEQDMELYYWRSLWGVANERKEMNSPAGKWLKMKEAFDANLSGKVGVLPKDQEIGFWRDLWSNYKGDKAVDDFTERKAYLPRFEHTMIQHPEIETGKPTYYRFDIDMEKARSHQLIGHAVTGASTPLVPKSGGLKSTDERLRFYGQYLKGMSSGTDMQNGGSSFVFTRQNGGHAYGDPTIFVSPDVIGRTTNFSYNDDIFGDLAKRNVGSAFDQTAMTKHTANDNELDIKNSLSLLDSIEMVVFPSPVQRDDAINFLHKFGITEIRGMSVEDRLVLKNNQYSATQKVMAHLKKQWAEEAASA